MPASTRILSHRSLAWSLRKAYAFVRRDFLFETSYKLQSVFRISNVVLQIFVFYFLARLIDNGGQSSHLAKYGDYFTFVLVGLSFTGFFNAGLINFTIAIRQQMSVGVFEYLAVTPIRSASLLLYSLLWPLVFELVKAMTYLFVGATFLGAELSVSHWPTLIATTILSLAVFGSLGVIAVSLIVYLKRGDPIAWLLSSASQLIGGILFPITVLPSWLQTIASLLPIPYAVDAFRWCLISSASEIDVARNLKALVIFTVITVPLAWFCANAMFNAARRNGSIGLH